MNDEFIVHSKWFMVERLWPMICDLYK